MNNINEIKDLINNAKYEGSLEYFLEENEELEDMQIEFIETLSSEEHRWFTIETNVYKFSKNNLEIGVLAINEIGTIKSEMMGYEDCGIELEAMNVKEIIKKSYEIIS